jgi:hypothetical protein
MKPNIGDVVQVWKSVMGREFRAQGRVEQLRYDRSHGAYLMRVGSDWWLAANDLENGYKILQPPGARCRLCGEVDVEMEPTDIVMLYDENGEPDDGGCFSEHHTEWQCLDRAACRDRRRQMWELAKEQARWADMEAREAGAFGIGAGVG